jgi:hypothetical protein
LGIPNLMIAFFTRAAYHPLMNRYLNGTASHVQSVIHAIDSSLSSLAPVTGGGPSPQPLLAGAVDCPAI